MIALIFANGSLDKKQDVSLLIDQADMIIAVDGGGNHCHTLGVTPTILIGDLDSIDPEVLLGYEKSNIPIQKHPPKKDATDLELALDFAVAQDTDTIYICAALGGRWDMSLANIQLCASNKYNNLTISLFGKDCIIDILQPGPTHTINNEESRNVSLLPLKSDVTGVTLNGFEYPLVDRTITFGSSLGVSNVIQTPPATITFKTGILLCIQNL